MDREIQLGPITAAVVRIAVTRSCISEEVHVRLECRSDAEVKIWLGSVGDCGVLSINSSTI